MSERSHQRAWRLVRATIRRWRTTWGRGILGGLTWRIAGVAAPLVVAVGVDRGVVKHDHRALWLAAAGLVGLGLAEAAGQIVRHWFACNAHCRSDADLIGQVTDRALELDAGWHDAHPAGSVLARASTDVERVAIVVDTMGYSTSSVISLFIIAALLGWLDPLLGLLLIVPLPLLTVATWHYTIRYRERAAVLQEAISDTMVAAGEAVEGFRVVKGLGAEDAVTERYRARTHRARQGGLAMARLDASYQPMLDLVPVLLLAAFVWWGGHRVIDGDLTVGQLVAALAYATYSTWPMRVLGQWISHLQRAAASAGRIAEVIDAQPAITEPDAPVPWPAGTAGPLAVRFENVHFAFPTAPERPVLTGVDLTVEAGTSVAIVGATGAGKSALVSLVNRTYDATGGRVLVDGRDVRTVPLHRLREAVAVAPQHPFVFSAPLAANVTMDGDGDVASGSRAAAALDRAVDAAGLRPVVEGLPAGAATVIGERGTTLSGGQRQRLTLARALFPNAPVLVLDDATSALDPVVEADVLHRIRGQGGPTTLFVTHRAAVAAIADRVVLLAGGRIAASGTHAQLLATEPGYRAVLGLDEAGGLAR